MANLPDQQWMIEVNSQETGPFSLDQVRGLLKEHQILPSFRVKKRSQPSTAWITVTELLKQMEAFTPPPRPNTQKGEVTRITVVRPGLKNDPTENLFEALQSHKEKTSAIQRPTPLNQFNAQQGNTPRPKPAWASPILLLLVGTTFALGFLLWSAFEIVQLSKKTEQKMDKMDPASFMSKNANKSPIQTVVPNPVTPNTAATNTGAISPNRNSRVQKTLPSSADPKGRIQIITERPPEKEESIVEPAEEPNAIRTGRVVPNKEEKENRMYQEESFRRDDPYDSEIEDAYPLEETNEIYVEDQNSPEIPIQE